MGEERSWANQRNKTLKSLLYNKKKKIKNIIFWDIWTLFEIEQEKEEKRKSEKLEKKRT